MIDNYAHNLWIQIANGASLGRNSMLFFGVLFFLIFSSLKVVGQAPNYTYDAANSKDLDYFTVKIEDATNIQAKLNRLIVAVDNHPNGEQYVLTFGNGIKRVNPIGVLVNFIPNDMDRLSNALDFAINSDGKFYVATNESNRRYVRVYSSSGAYLSNETLGDGTYDNDGHPNKFKGPTGLAFDRDDNLYVADHYIGDDNPSKPSSIKIYRKDAVGNYKNNLISQFDNIGGTLLNFPFRLAVNSLRQLYVSELGGDEVASVKILQLDAGFNPTKIGEIGGALSAIGSTGSIVIDKFDNTFILDFGDEINLPRLLTATDDPNEFAKVFEIIKKGIQNNIFKINIYNPDNSFNSIIADGIDFPIDLAISKCGTLYVNNSIFDGKFNPPICIPFTNICTPPIPDISLDFDLEIHQRSSGYEMEKPVMVCPSDITKDVDSGKNYATVNFNKPTATDNCSTPTVLQTKGPASGSQFSEGTTTEIEFTATDASGNQFICSFTVTVNAVAGTDTEDPVISCPTPITQNVDSGKCGAIVTFTNATATDNSVVAPTITRVDNTGLNSGDLFPVGSTTITFRATDGSGNFQDCSFLITITDNEKPSISCPDPISETVAFGESGKVISYAALSSADNCSGSTITQTAGIASGSEFPVGKTTNTFVVTDASNNTATCSFDVTITESSDTEKPEITCPAPITRNVDLGKCGAVVTFADATATDNSGSVTVTLISNLASGSEFPVGNSTVTFEAKDSAGNTAECSFIITVIDNEKPTISCPQNIIETAPFGETGKVITYPASSAADNCSGSIITQTAGFASGSEFPIGKTTNTFEVTDASGNTATCSFDVTITVNTDTEKPVITCPDNINQNTDSGKCGAIVTFADATATDNSGDVTVTLISGLPSGSEFPVGNSTVTFEAKDSAGNTEKCSFIITIIDNEKPTISCPNSISETVNSGETGKVITYSFPSSGDNCSGSTITQTAGFASGSEFPLGTTTNTFVVTDASNNTSTCSFDVTITENADAEKPVITCPASITQNVDSEKCGAIVTFTDATATDNYGSVTVKLISNLPSGSEFPVGESIVKFEAKDAAGNSTTCSFTITVINNSGPTVNCPKDILINYSTEKTFTIPDFSIEYFSTDNCNTTFDYTQNPAIGSVITEDTMITYSVGGTNGIYFTCNINIKFIENTELRITNCPGDQNFEVGENCEFTVPDYTSTITANDSDAIITQSIPAGTEINNALPITITASLDGQTASCEFQLIPKDSIDPVVICPGDVSETYNPEDGFALPNYSLQAQTSDNCTVAKINQIPDVGTVIFENTEVTVRIEDIFGNSATCTFNVILTEENTVNTPPVATDDIYTTMQDVNLTVPASTGVLSNDTDGEGDGLSAILISSVSSGTLSLNQDGSFIYEPNAGFFGTDSFTYVSNDGIENSEIATVRIDVVAVSGNTIICKEAITLELNENGTATLNAENLFVTRPANLQFSIDKESFTCDDLGEIRIKLSYSNDVIQGSCEVVVTVKDVTPPTVNVKDITVALNEFRSVRITPEMVDNGSSDNCENITLSLDKLNFSCKELGENIVTLTVTDSSGNSSSATARVTVTGSCDLEPLPVVEYIFIYPNPTTGPFQFATPAGVTIQRVEAFDARGRMIMFKEFSVADLQYTMDLNGVQKAVYILKLFTSDGLDIKRVIIK